MSGRTPLRTKPGDGRGRRPWSSTARSPAGGHAEVVVEQSAGAGHPGPCPSPTPADDSKALVEQVQGAGLRLQLRSRGARRVPRRRVEHDRPPSGGSGQGGGRPDPGRPSWEGASCSCLTTTCAQRSLRFVSRARHCQAHRSRYRLEYAYPRATRMLRELRRGAMRSVIVRRSRTSRCSTRIRRCTEIGYAHGRGLQPLISTARSAQRLDRAAGDFRTLNVAPGVLTPPRLASSWSTTCRSIKAGRSDRHD